MYAIIRSGSKQYCVKKDDVICVELLDQISGNVIEFKDVLFLNDGTNVVVGEPTIPGCSVKGELLEVVKGPKVIAFKYKKRKNFRKKIGHRQHYSQVKITEITR